MTWNRQIYLSVGRVRENLYLFGLLGYNVNFFYYSQILSDSEHVKYESIYIWVRMRMKYNVSILN